MTAKKIITAALKARTLEDAQRVQSLIESHIAARHTRPVADRVNNGALLKASGGSYDLKLVELVTNMQDAVLELETALKYGDAGLSPHHTPHEAAASLLADDHRNLAARVLVEFWPAGEQPRSTRRLTATFRDSGIGMTPEQIPETIFRLGSAHKTDYLWTQGAFGVGGATTYPNAEAIIVISRRDPRVLQPGEADRISVAVVEWEYNQKTRGAYYLTTEPWPDVPTAPPLSFDASEFPKFEPGTFVSLISYGVEGYHRARLGDERSFDTVLNTRLFSPVTPVQFSHRISGRARNEYLRGLERRLEDNPRDDRRKGTNVLPFRANGETYHLPIRYYVFAAKGEPGELRKFVAHDHAVVFTSNGQVHHHWTPVAFKSRSGLSKLYNRIFVVVETDELPLAIRSELFTGDRMSMMGNEVALRLEEQVAAFLTDWTDLNEINSELIREAIQGSNEDRPTIHIARQISRALKVRGFTTSGTGRGGGGGGGGPRRPPADLYEDPTTLEGPSEVLAEDGKTKFVHFFINAKDDFIPNRAQLQVTCDHPEVGEREITVGQLRRGVVRVSVAVPLNTTFGVYRLDVRLDGWLKSGGGLGPTMEWTTKFEVVDEVTLRPGGGSTGKKGKTGASEGDLVALLWTTHEEEEDWDKATVGDVLPVRAVDLATRPEYEELANLGDQKIPTIRLNREYTALKTYVGGRARNIQDPDALRNRYAVGVGVGLMVQEREIEKRAKKGEQIDEKWVGASRQAIARGVLAMMPEYDLLAREAGLEEDE